MRRPACASRLRRFLPAVVLVPILAGSGCVNQLLTKAIVEAPNEREVPYVLRPENAKLLKSDDELYATSWMLSVGPPSARLAVAVVEPGDYGMVHSIETGTFKNGRAPVWPKTAWTLPAKKLPGSSPPKATILVLHGYQDCKEDMLHWALYLAQANYRVVLVDLRGHGRSTGDWIGYGAFEVRDLRQVLDDLQKRGLVTGPVGVLGLSYGASLGLQLAGHDPRVGAVVAIEPFSNPRGAVVEFAHAVVPGLVKSWTAQDFSTAEDRAGRLAHFSWQDADVLASVARTDAPILYAYATRDHWISPENTKLLAANTRSIHSVLVMNFTDDGGIENHVLLSWTLDPVAPPILKWLDECLLRPGPGLRERLAALGML
jgi:pimeloyl-ACP methyl ester carboxylesterase